MPPPHSRMAIIKKYIQAASVGKNTEKSEAQRTVAGNATMMQPLWKQFLKTPNTVAPATPLEIQGPAEVTPAGVWLVG